MGVDIHMSIIDKDGKYRYRGIFYGRNSEWFDNICRNGYYNSLYANFPTYSGIPELVPNEVKEDYDEEDYCFDFHYMMVADFCKWFDKIRPDIDAGWVTTYKKWLYEKKGIVPEVKQFLNNDDNIADYHFIEVKDSFDCSKWLKDFITEHGDISPEDYIIYYFDC